MTEEEFLKSRGWYQLWHPDNWVHQSSKNPDYTGVSKQQALSFEKEKDMTALDWELHGEKWRAANG